jgi:hypothetical protein
LGAGPFQRGTIYKGTQFAGRKIRVPKLNDEPHVLEDGPIALQEQFHFPRRLAAPGMLDDEGSNVEVAGFEERLPDERPEKDEPQLPPVIDGAPTSKQGPPEVLTTEGADS